MKVPSLIPALTVAALLSASFASAAGPTKQECVTANSDAQDLRRAGKMREARVKLAVCVVQSCPGPVREDCAQRLDEVDRSMPSIVFDVKDGGGNDVTATRVTMDREPLADHLDGSSLAVDPGKHHFVFQTAGASDIAKDIVIREGEKDRHESIAFAANARTDVGDSGPSKDTTDKASTPSRWPVYTAFGVGAAGIIVGSIFGVLALSTKSSLDSECPSKSGCPQSDIDALSTRGWASNIGFAVGIVGAGVGTILLLTSGGDDRPSVGIRIGPSLVGLVGTLP